MPKNISPKDSSPIGSIELHEKIVKETLLLVGSQTFCRVWRNDTGRGIKLSGYYYAKKNSLPLQVLEKSMFKYGLIGSADIMGILQGGRILCIEIKSGKATQSPVQKNFQKMIQGFGGIYIVANSAEQALHSVTHCLDS